MTSMLPLSVLAFFCASVTAFVPATCAATTNTKLYSADVSGARVRSVFCKESKEDTVKLDEDMLRAVAAAASMDVDEQQQRIDAALAELGRSGDLANAAAVGGFSKEVVGPPEEVTVPAWLTIAPPAVGAFSVVLFVLNAFGVFGEGPDLSTLTG